MDDPRPTKWLLRLTAAVGIATLTLSTASARILFQNDYEFQMEADNLVIDSDANGGNGSVFVKFNNSGTAADNGVISWDITNKKFVFDQDIELNATVNASASTSFRMREEADIQNGVTACTTTNEIALDTGEGSIYMCTDDATDEWTKISSDPTTPEYASDPTCDAGATGDLIYNTTDDRLKYCDGTSWLVIGPQDLEEVFANDADGTLTTGDQNFGIDTGTADFDVTNTGNINFNTGAFDLDATDVDIDATTFDLNAVTQNFIGSDISFDSDDWDITAGGAATFVSTTTTDLTATGDVDFSGATSVRTREVVSIATAACTVLGELVLDTSTNKLYSCTTIGAPGTFKLQGGGGKVEQLAFNPEYANAVVNAITGSGSNKGTLTSAFASNRQFYKWITTQAALQDIDIKVKFTLPEDFSSFGTLLLDYQTSSATAANNNVDITLKDVTVPASPVTCGSASGLANASWTTNTIAAATLTSGCGSSVAGNTMELTINLATINAGNFAHVGQVKLNYNN